MKYYYLFFKKNRLLLLKKHFETGMIMVPKNIFFLLFHSTVHAAHINIIRPNDRQTRSQGLFPGLGQGKGPGNEVE